LGAAFAFDWEEAATVAVVGVPPPAALLVLAGLPLDALDFALPLLGIDIPPPCLVVIRLSWSKGIFAFVLEAEDAEGLAFAFALEAIAPGGGQLPSVFVVDAIVAVVVRLRLLASRLPSNDDDNDDSLLAVLGEEEEDDDGIVERIQSNQISKHTFRFPERYSYRASAHTPGTKQNDAPCFHRAGQNALVHTILTQLLQRGRPRNEEATAETTTTTTAKPVIPSESISRCTTIGPWAMSFPPSTTTGTPQ